MADGPQPQRRFHCGTDGSLAFPSPGAFSMLAGGKLRPRLVVDLSSKDHAAREGHHGEQVALVLDTYRQSRSNGKSMVMGNTLAQRGLPGAWHAALGVFP